MREIIQFQIGGCGNHVGNKYWDLIRQEHLLDYEGKPVDESRRLNDNIFVAFNEQNETRFVPRSIFVDLEPGSIEAVRESPSGRLYRPDNFIAEQNGSGGKWSAALYSIGAEVMETVLDVARREIERADNVHGFQIIHSLAGNTGGGMGSLLMTKLREEFPEKLLWACSIAPAAIGSEITSPYNVVLTMHHLIEHADSVVLLDDDAMYNACRRNYKANPTNKNLNVITARILSDITSSMRFNGDNSTNLRKLSTTLVPFPRSHFFMAGCAPLNEHIINDEGMTLVTLGEMTQKLFDPNNSLSDRSAMTGKHLTAHCFFRGNIPSAEIDAQMTRMIDRQSGQCVAWVPDNIKTSLCDVPLTRVNMSSSYLANSTSLADTCRAMIDRFNRLFTRRAYLYHLCGEGMDEMEFTEARENVCDLVAEYQMYQDATRDQVFDAAYDNDDEVE